MFFLTSLLGHHSSCLSSTCSQPKFIFWSSDTMLNVTVLLVFLPRITQLSIEISIHQILPLLNVNDTILLKLNFNKLILSTVSDSFSNYSTLVFCSNFIKLNFFIQYHSSLFFVFVCISMHLWLRSPDLLN